MKTRHCVTLFCIAIASNYVNSCPTCVGRVSRQSAPFFTDDCYQRKQHAQAQPKTKKEQQSQKTLKTTST